MSSPAPQFESISSSALSLPYGPTLTSVHDYWKNHHFDYMELCRQSNVSGTLVNRISALIEGAPESSLPLFPLCESQRESGRLQLDNRSSPEPYQASTARLPASGTGKHYFLLFRSHPVDGIVLQQPELRHMMISAG